MFAVLLVLVDFVAEMIRKSTCRAMSWTSALNDRSGKVDTADQLYAHFSARVDVAVDQPFRSYATRLLRSL